MRGGHPGRWLLALLIAAGSLGGTLAATAQEATPMATPTAAAVSSMPLEVKVGQLIIAGVIDPVAGDDARHVIEDLHVGNIILMGRNYETPEQVLTLTQELQAMAIAANGVPLIIGTDQEGGTVQRATYTDGFTPLPAAALVGETGNPDLAERYGAMVGAELAAVGVSLDFAPVLDVNDNPDNPVIGQLGRSFGPTVADVEATALPFAAGLAASNVIVVGKHFPGHGSTSTDSHLDLPFVEKSRADLDAIDIAPFAAAVAAGIPGIMPAHVVYPALDPDLPATLSSAIQTDLLRGELGFAGVIFTDDLGMAGITAIAPPGESSVRAILAGADVVTCVRMDLPSACPPAAVDEIHAGLLAAVADGTLSEERIDESVTRILALKAAYNVGPATGDQLDVIQSPEHLRLVGEIYTAVADRREAAP